MRHAAYARACRRAGGREGARSRRGRRAILAARPARDAPGPPQHLRPERLRALTIAASLASLPFILPHVVEDFEHGIAQRAHLTTGVGAFLLGGFLAAQSLGLVLVGQGRRSGFLVTMLVAAIWIVGAVVEHGSVRLAAVGGSHSDTSLPWLVGLLLTQLACLVLAGMALRR
jgi:hypothetical protein